MLAIWINGKLFFFLGCSLKADIQLGNDLCWSFIDLLCTAAAKTKFSVMIIDLRFFLFGLCQKASDDRKYPYGF